MPEAQIIPEWLSITQAVADVVCKVAVALAAALVSPRFISALRTWHEVKSAQLVSERDLERQRRLAVEADFERANRLLPHLEQSTTLAAQQLADLQRTYQELLAKKGTTESSLDRDLLPIVTRLVYRAVTLEIVRHNLLRGQEMGKELLRKEPGKDNAKPPALAADVPIEAAAGAFLLVGPKLFGDQPEEVFAAARDLAALTSAPEELLRLAGSSLASRPEVVEQILFAARWGSPAPIGEEYVIKQLSESDRKRLMSSIDDEGDA